MPNLQSVAKNKPNIEAFEKPKPIKYKPVLNNPVISVVKDEETKGVKEDSRYVTRLSA